MGGPADAPHEIKTAAGTTPAAVAAAAAGSDPADGPHRSRPRHPRPRVCTTFSTSADADAFTDPAGVGVQRGAGPHPPTWWPT